MDLIPEKFIKNILQIFKEKNIIIIYEIKFYRKRI